LSDIVKEISCSHCGGPLSIKPGEIVVTCKYCGFTSVLETGKAFEFEHSLIVNKYVDTRVAESAKRWMNGSFAGPRDLAHKATVVENELFYLPFWVVVTGAHSHCRGIFERISPPVTKEWDTQNDYSWLVLARRGSDFPTRSYEMPLEAKIPYDFTKIEGNAKVLNAEIDANEATEMAQREIRELHEFLAKDTVDKIVEMNTEFDVKSTLYLHSPIWFVSYDYRKQRYRILVDGATGEVIKGDLPAPEFKLL
jgi:hypothetical protein